MSKQKTKKNKHTTTKNTNISNEIKGVLDVTRTGIGYVVIPDGTGDVLVRQNDFNTALHGDTVRVKVLKENLNSGRKEGKITEVISRKQTEFIGHLQAISKLCFFYSRY
ncbi:MAG: hypothetical protein V9E96_04305 [Chitinophagaceae bacterium]